MSDPVVVTASPFAPRRLAPQVAVAIFVRLFINTSRRFVYPFAPALSRGLDVPLTAVTSLIAMNQFTGILSPFFGPLSDRWGYRVMMLVGLAFLAVGMISAGIMPLYGTVLVALLFAGLTKAIFDPALQAYIAEQVPYQRRGTVMGLIELSWAGASLVGIPLIGILIERLGWRAPFLVLGGLALLSMAAIALLIPPDRHRLQQRQQTINIYQAWQLLRREKPALGVLLFSFLSNIANDNLFVVYGVWLEESFSLGLVALGTATTVIGVAELAGELLTAAFADRLGLKRSIIIGLSLVILSYLLLPVIGRTLPLALTGLFVVFLWFEFTIVTNVSLITEVLPSARATMISASVAVSGLGRMIGALIAGPVWLWGGLPATGFVSALLSLLALFFFIWGLRRWRA
jgi:predicted MFS family arabinose efflux permease